MKNGIGNPLVRLVASNGIVAALYVVLTLVTLPVSYSYMQFRLSELLNLLVFFNPWYTVGLTVGCLLANLFSTVGAIDIVLGTAATLASCLIVIVLSRFVKSLFISGIVPCLVNAAVVPFIIYIAANFDMEFTASIYFVMFGWVFLGEFLAILCVGYPLFMILGRTHPGFMKMILASRNKDFKW